jgi:signal transduction histidine kinase
MRFCAKLLILLVFFIGCNQDKPSTYNYSEIDALISRIKQSDVENPVVNAQIDSLKVKIETVVSDSIQRSYLRKLSNIYFNLNKYDDYYKLCHRTLKLSFEANDSLMTSKYYRDIGDYHLYQTSNDSAYFYFNLASKWFRRLKADDYLGYVLMQKARLNYYEKNYSQSEVFYFEALKIAQKTKDQELILNIYISLGNLYLYIKDFEQSKLYFDQGLDVLEKNEDLQQLDFFTETIYNNLGLLALEKNELNAAISFFDLALKNNDLKEVKPILYAAVKGNSARAKMRVNQLNDINQILEPLTIRKNIKNSIGEAISLHDLGEFYEIKKDTLDSRIYYEKSLALSKEIKYSEGILQALKSLSKLNPITAAKYQNKLLKITDSLYNQERTVRNKFAKVEFETDQLLIENQLITRQRQLMLYGIIATILLGSIGYLYYRQRVKNKEFFLIQEQQKANEEVYNLLITQQNRISDARNEEKNRISRELHDGIQSKLTGIRLNLSILKRRSDPETIKKVFPYIEGLKDVENEVREISHDLRAENMSQETFVSLIKDLVKVQNANQSYKVFLKINNNIDWDFYPNITKVNLYRIIQESLQNILKYAQCKKVKILLDLLNENLVLSISDDGVGFKQQKFKKGIGIINMEERVKMLGGEFIIFSKINEGTIITINIPYNERK